MDDAWQETVDYVAIYRLQRAYADTVTRRAWPELHDQFLADAAVRVDTVTNPVVELAGPQAVGDFIAGAVERFELFEFAILNSHVSLRAGGDVDAATGRVYIWELRQDAATGHFTSAFGLYQDAYRRVDGRWWFARRDYRSLARTGRLEVFGLPETG
jgi:hypothetical protein